MAHTHESTQPGSRTAAQPHTHDPLCKPTCCPSCGGVECFERPRFFCGQLLTDRDLEAAQRYVIEKNKLHNRYLVGSGVVCGLAVRCDPCDECAVRVESGYAIDCCGNDIVLCEPASFNVCEYIEKCLREKEPACEDKIKPRSRCDELPKEYCLLLSYAEEPARPVTALIRDNGCRNSRCEPSRTKETFRLDLIERAKEDGDKPHRGMIGRFQHCIETLGEISKLQEELKQVTSNDEAWELYCKFKKTIIDLYRKGPYVRCTLESELCRLEETSTGLGSHLRPVAASSPPLLQLLVLVMDYLRDCICDALLVRCGECEEPTGVILACLTMENKKIVKICNLARTQVITGPALRYWFGFLFDSFGAALEKFCCETDFAAALRPRERAMVVEPTNAGRVVARVPATLTTMSRFASHATGKVDPAELLKMTRMFDATAVHAGDYLNRPVGAVTADLQKHNISVQVKRETSHEAAYALEHLTEMEWVIPEHVKQVELVVDPDDRVTAIRKL